MSIFRLTTCQVKSILRAVRCYKGVPTTVSPKSEPTMVKPPKTPRYSLDSFPSSSPFFQTLFLFSSQALIFNKTFPETISYTVSPESSRRAFLRASSMIEVLSAFHQSKYVVGDFEQRGGVMICAPPGALKSTIIKLSLEDYPDALLLSDLNVNTLTQLKNSLIDGRYNTLGFGEFEKLYKRNPATAANIEAHIQALVEEGFSRASFEDQRLPTFAARCAVVGGITPSCYAKRFNGWLESGFGRRFMFCSYTLANPDAIMNAIERWKHISFGKVILTAPGNKKIPYSIEQNEHRMIKRAISNQPTHEGPFIMCKKILCVLKWRHNRKKAMDIFLDFAECLESKGAALEI